MVRGLLLLLFVASTGCPSVARREDGRPGVTRCPSLSGLASQLDSFGSVTLHESRCEPNESCSEGDYVCRCDVARGGAPHPDWWTCHRARQKRNGCPDDEVLLRGDACTTEGQMCAAPRACGCSFSIAATCQRGRWALPASCEPCLAP